MSNHITQGVLFKGLSKKALVARFDQEQASSDCLLKACDERLGLSAAMALCLRDARQQGKVDHSSGDFSATDVRHCLRLC